MPENGNGMTQHEMLMELREDMRLVKRALEEIARDQALGVERRRNMQVTADNIMARLAQADQERRELRQWQLRADGAITPARWALGASVISLLTVVWQVFEAMQHGGP